MLTKSGPPLALGVTRFGASNGADECLQLDLRFASGRSEFASIRNWEPIFILIDVLAGCCLDVRAEVLGLCQWGGCCVGRRGGEQESGRAYECSTKDPAFGCGASSGPLDHCGGTHVAMPGFPI